MNLELIREYALEKKGVTESFPFDETTLVFKVQGKIFLLMSLEGDFTLCLKCDPELAVQLREQFSFVQPGYHMSKKHWNTISIDSEISDTQILGWIDHSYQQVLAKLPKTLRENLK